MKVLKINPYTGQKYYFKLRTQSPWIEQRSMVLGVDGLLSSLINKVISSTASRKVASTLTSKVSKDLAMKAVLSVIQKGSSEVGTTLSKLVGNKVHVLLL